MHKILCWCLQYRHVLLCILSLSKAAAIPALISTNTNLNLIAPTAANLSDPWPDLPNEDFEYSVHYHGSSLPDVACMMVTVFAMRELALLPDFSDIVPGKTWILNGYPHVAMSVEPPGDILTVRWTMWTVSAAIRDMMRRNHFQTSEFVGTYFGIRVAVVKFFAPNTIETVAVAKGAANAVPQIAGGASIANQSTATISIHQDDRKVNATSNDDQLWAILTYKTKEISRRDMFNTVIWMLLNLAPHKNDERVLVITVTAPAITASVTTHFIRVPRIPSRIEPLKYANLISLLAKLPEVLLRENMFREMDIVVKDVDVAIGKGTLRSTDSDGFVGFPLTANIVMS